MNINPIKKLFDYTSYLTIIFTLIAVWYVGYELFRDYNIIEMKEEPMVVVTKVVKRGEVFSYNPVFCKHYPFPGEITRVLINDSHNYNLGTSLTNTDTGCVNYTSSNVVIPEHVVPGVYAIEVTLVYKPSFVREVVYKIKTEKFIIE